MLALAASLIISGISSFFIGIQVWPDLGTFSIRLLLVGMALFTLGVLFITLGIWIIVKIRNNVTDLSAAIALIVTGFFWLFISEGIHAEPWQKLGFLALFIVGVMVGLSIIIEKLILKKVHEISGTIGDSATKKVETTELLGRKSRIFAVLSLLLSLSPILMVVLALPLITLMRTFEYGVIVLALVAGLPLLGIILAIRAIILYKQQTKIRSTDEAKFNWGIAIISIIANSIAFCILLFITTVIVLLFGIS